MTEGILYGMPESGCTQRVRVVCYEHNIDVPLSLVDATKGEHKSETHVDRQVICYILHFLNCFILLYFSKYK